MTDEFHPLGHCLVTGAGGFIGRQLCSVLKSRAKSVRILLRTPTSNPDCDIAVVGEIGKENFDYVSLLEGIDSVFHLASTAHSSVTVDQYKIDCDATLTLAQKAEDAGVRRFIYVSSSRAVLPSGEVSLMNWPHDEYGYWKRMTEQRLLDEINVSHLAILRPCLVYGLGVKGNLDLLIKAIIKGYFPPIPASLPVRSMVSSTDVVNALLLIATNRMANRKCLVAADGELYTAGLIYQAVTKALGRSIPGWAIPSSLLRLSGIVGDGIRFVWTDFPVSSDGIGRLIRPAIYSAEDLLSLGWRPTVTFYTELPAILSSYTEK